MNVIRRHKGLALVGGLTLILLIIIFVILSRMIFSSSDSKYGDRLNNLVKIDSKETEKLVSEMKEKEEITKFNVDVKGKIIYIVFHVTEGTSKDKAKEIAKKTLEYFSEEELECYDIEYLIKQDKEIKDGEEDTSYSLAGTKHSELENISWTRK